MVKGTYVNGVYSIGNLKLSTNTLIFNLTSAKDCPSKQKGLCKVCKICYARKSELRFPKVLAYRDRQTKYWDLHNTIEICGDMHRILKKRPYIRFLRYNEAGDFRNQLDVDKLSDIAGFIKRNYDVVTYGYTARSDLDFSKAQFIVRGSGWKAKDGMTEVWPKDAAIQKGNWLRINSTRYWVCPGKDCMDGCVMCACTAHAIRNIIFIQH